MPQKRSGPNIHENTNQNLAPPTSTTLNHTPHHHSVRDASNKYHVLAHVLMRRYAPLSQASQRLHIHGIMQQTATKRRENLPPCPPQPLPLFLQYPMTILLSNRHTINLTTARIGIRHNHRCHRRELLLLGVLQRGLVLLRPCDLLRHRICAAHVAPHTSLQGSS